MRDSLSIIFLGWRGPLGKWAANHLTRRIVTPVLAGEPW